MVGFAMASSSLTSASVLSLAFSGDYLPQFINVPSILAALVFVVIVGCINFYGISESVRLNLAFTCIEISGLLLIVLIGVVTLGSGTGEPTRALEFKEGVSLLPAVRRERPREEELGPGYPRGHGMIMELGVGFATFVRRE
jgi:APA family basic amino acid/polyamine antiporter